MTKRIVKLAIVGFLLVLSLSVYAQKKEEPKKEVVSKKLTINFGKEPSIDGKIEQEEWVDAVKIESDKLTLYFKHSDTHLWIGLTYTRAAVVNIFIQPQESTTIYVLHSSAALGEAKYNYDKDQNAWLLEKRFHFGDFHNMRRKNIDEGKSDEEALKMTMEQFEKDNGWVANLSETRRRSRAECLLPSYFEFRISYDKLGINPAKIKPNDKKTIPIIKLVAGISDGGNGKVTAWPSGVKDDCVNEGLHMGNAIKKVGFEPEKYWASIISSDNWLKPKEEKKKEKK